MDQRTPKNPFGLPGVNDSPVRRRRGMLRYVPGGAKTVVVGLAALLVALLVWAIKPNPNARPANPFFAGRNAPMPVGVAKASLGDIDVMLNALGTVTPLATVTVKPQVGGQLVKIDFQEGQIIKAGATLAEIDPRPYQAALDQAQGALARDQAQLANAQVDLNRYQTLQTQNSIAGQQVDTQAALVRQLQGTIKADEAAVETSKINLEFSFITSPITGLAGLRQVDLGNLLIAGQTTGIVVLTQMQPMSVVFTVPEDNIDQISARVRAGAHLQAQAYDRGQTHLIATGMLATLDNQIDVTTGTVKLRAMFDNPDNLLYPNQFVNIRLLVDTLHNQIVVPVSAVQRGASGTFVYAINPDHTASMRAVTLGVTNDDRVAIAKGLESGDTVVVDGADRLRDGAKVILPGEQLPAVAGNQQGGNQAAGAAGRRGGRRGGQGGQGGRGGRGGAGAPGVAGAAPAAGAAAPPAAGPGAGGG